MLDQECNEREDLRLHRACFAAVPEFPLGKIEFEFPEVSGSAHVKYSKDIILTELSLSSDSEISVVFQYDENVRFEGLRTFRFPRRRSS